MFLITDISINCKILVYILYMIKYIILLAIIIIFKLCFYKKSNIQLNNYGKIVRKNRKNIVIDAFIYFQESLMLSIRLFRMNQYVDYFIIVTAATTFSGLSLQVNFSPYESYIQKYKKKIVFYNISHPPYCKTTWCREKYQRNKISDAVKSINPSNESIVIISDLDEIPTSNAMKYILENPPIELYILSGYMYYYNYRNKFKGSWSGIIVVKSCNCKNLQKYRDRSHDLLKTNSIPVNPSLTHCSFCYKNISSIQKKLHSFSHSEFNKPPYTEKEYLMKCIKNHIHFARKYKFQIVKYDTELLPLPNDKRFDYLKEENGIT